MNAKSNLRAAFKLIRSVAAHPEAYPDDFVAIPLDPDILSRIFSPERVRLLREVRQEGPFESVGKLARALGREQSRVSRDLSDLENAGLVKLVRKGKSKQVTAPVKPILVA